MVLTDGYGARPPHGWRFRVLDTQNVGCHATGAVSVADLIVAAARALLPDLPRTASARPLNSSYPAAARRSTTTPTTSRDTEAIAIPAHCLSSSRSS